MTRIRFCATCPGLIDTFYNQIKVLTAGTDFPQLLRFRDRKTERMGKQNTEKQRKTETELEMRVKNGTSSSLDVTWGYYLGLGCYLFSITLTVVVFDGEGWLKSWKLYHRDAQTTFFYSLRLQIAKAGFFLNNGGDFLIISHKCVVSCVLDQFSDPRSRSVGGATSASVSHTLIGF